MQTITPYYSIDLDVLDATLVRAADQAKALDIALAMALKGFPLPAAFPTIAPHITAVTASGLYEAKLAQGFGRPVHVHAPAYREDEMDELCSLCSHIVFNTSAQLRRFGPQVRSRGVSVGLRVNPGFAVSESPKYDPCRVDSRYGVLPSELTDEDLALVDGRRVGYYLFHDDGAYTPLDHAGLMDTYVKLTLTWKVCEWLKLSTYAGYSDFLFDRKIREAARRYEPTGDWTHSWNFVGGCTLTAEF